MSDHSAVQYLKAATAEVRKMRDDLNLSLYILETRDEVRALDEKIEAKGRELREFMSLPHGGRKPGSTMLLDRARNLTADIARLRSFQIPLVNRLRDLEQQQREEA